MKQKKLIIIIILYLCLFCSFTGCKDTILKSYNNSLQSFSKNTLTKDKKLQGKKKKGIDEYTGTYKANYNHFNKKEIIFGGTCLKRKEGNDLKMIYNLKISSGKAVLYWIKSGKKYIIADINKKDKYEFTIDSGDNYIVLEGDDFSGSLYLTVK